MGFQQSKLARQELEKYEKLTFFTSSEISRLYEKFEALGGTLTKPISSTMMLTAPELKINPFRHRIVYVFGSSPENVDQDDGTRTFSFDDYVQMMNAFSARTSLEVRLTGEKHVLSRSLCFLSPVLSW
jgi:Ca2+-binding EF-hand superfamily protein